MDNFIPTYVIGKSQVVVLHNEEKIRPLLWYIDLVFRGFIAWLAHPQRDLMKAVTSPVMLGTCCWLTQEMEVTGDVSEKAQTIAQENSTQVW